MTWANEEKGDNGQPKKSELLPTGDKAKEIIEVLAAIYRTVYKPEDAVDDHAKDEHASQ